MDYKLLFKNNLLQEDKPNTLRFHLEELFLDCIYVLAYFIIQSYYHKLLAFNLLILIASLFVIFYTI